MAKDIKLYKGNNEVIVNELQVDNFIKLGWKQDKDNKSQPKKDKGKWQHITEKKE